MDRFIEFMLSRMKVGTNEEKLHRVLGFTVFLVALLSWGLITVSMSNVSLKSENTVLRQGVAKVNLILDTNSPDSPLYSVVRSNAFLTDKLYRTNQVNADLTKEILDYAYKNAVLKHKTDRVVARLVSFKSKLAMCIVGKPYTVLRVNQRKGTIQELSEEESKLLVESIETN